MKPLRIAWILSALWAAFCIYQGLSIIERGWNHESSLLEWGEKIKLYLAGIGTFTVGSGPLLATWLVHKFHKSRERGRLMKEQKRIEARLKKLDAERDAKAAKKAQGKAPASGQATAS